jgi:hypothetical protein
VHAPVQGEVSKKKRWAINSLRATAENSRMAPKRWSESREALAALAKLAEEGLKERSPLARMEEEIEAEKRRIGQREMDARLASLPPEAGKPQSCPKCGKRAPVRAKAVSRTFKSLSGTHTFSRNYHYCEKCKEGFYPQDEWLGLSKDSDVTEELERRMADFVVNDVYEQCASRFEVHYGLCLSENAFRLVGHRLGEKTESANEMVLQSVLLSPPADDTETLYVLNDGSMVSTREGWKEVKTAVLFREEKHLRGDEETRGAIEEARYVSVLGGQDEFKATLESALKSENAPCARAVVWVADGAKSNWLLARMTCPKAIQILDWYHAVENAASCAATLFGEQSALAQMFVASVRAMLWEGQVDNLLTELKGARRVAQTSDERKALSALIGYYGENAKRMDYARFRERGLLIGSGIVESAHRHVIHTRMKKAGQHWSQTGGRRMARMRAAYRTAGPARFYRAIRWAHRQTMAARPVCKPAKRYASNR